MATLLQVDFPFDGPWGAEMAQALDGLARDIAAEPGLIWKVWTESPGSGQAGGIYLFQTPEQAEAYRIRHTARLADFGITGLRAISFAVNDGLSAITRGPTPVAPHG